MVEPTSTPPPWLRAGQPLARLAALSRSSAFTRTYPESSVSGPQLPTGLVSPTRWPKSAIWVPISPNQLPQAASSASLSVRSFAPRNENTKVDMVTLLSLRAGPSPASPLRRSAGLQIDTGWHVSTTLSPSGRSRLSEQRAHLDHTRASARQLGGQLQGTLPIAHVHDVEPADLFLGLGEGAVADEHPLVTLADRTCTFHALQAQPPDPFPRDPEST